MDPFPVTARLSSSPSPDSSPSPSAPPKSSPPASNTDKSPPSPPPDNKGNSNRSKPESPESSPPSPPPPSPPPPPPSPPPPAEKSSPPPGKNNKSRGSPPPVQRTPGQRTPGALPPPPPRYSSKSPPPSKDSNSSPPTQIAPSALGPGDNDDDTGKIIAGFAIGASLLIVFMIVVLCTRDSRKKKGKNQHYGDSVKGGQRHYNNTQHASWHGNPHGPDQQYGGGWGAPSPLQKGSYSGESGAYSAMNHSPRPPPPPNMSLGFNKSTFTFDELAAATRGFAQANLLGQGGFGYVHKGVLPNGKEVAVKSLKSGSGQGEREFQAEVEIISRVHHRYLVSLVGYCISGDQRMLVYEFVPNKTLEYHLYENSPVMDFPTRLRIALGAAKGLAYIHEDCHPRIIHRDIKAANILLDEKFEAKVADFGLAKLSSDTYSHVSTRVMGTFGYLAPEYASSGKLTEKSDVFSFGIMLLELITGKRPVDITGTMEDSLVDWARPLLCRSLEDGDFSEIADPRLEGNYNPQEMASMAACAGASIRHSARKRPRMSQIVRALEGDVSLDDLNEGVKPGHSSHFSQDGSSDYSQSSYQADMKKFRQLALSSAEFTNSVGTCSTNSR